MKLLIGVPSPRNIKEVQEHWDTWDHDVLIVKNKPQIDAYTRLRNEFIRNIDYTHFCLIPDDLVVPKEKLELLWRLVESHDYPVVSGYCNIDESQLNVYNLQLDITDNDHPSADGWLNKNMIPVDDEVFELGFSGFPCMIIRRDVMMNVSWLGAGNIGLGSFDWKFCQDCKRLGIPVRVARDCKLYHMRFAQLEEVKKFKKNAKPDDGYLKWIKHG